MAFARLLRVGVVACLAALLLSIAQRRADGHGGGILVQTQGDQLAIGFDDEQGGEQRMGVRTFSLLFPSELARDTPSFLSLVTPPDGADPLPMGAELYWDFLPMNHDGLTANLLHWDGQGDVHFGAVPQEEVTIALYNVVDGVSAGVDGAALMTRGALVGTTDTLGNTQIRLHSHLWYYLDDNDGSEATAPPGGVYLIALRLRMEGRRASDPFYVAAATPGMLTELDAATSWVTDRIDTLVRAGDYNFDGAVDAGDYAAWRARYGEALLPAESDALADGNGDGVVNALDYTYWRDRTGRDLYLEDAVLPVPAPSGIAVVTAALAAFTDGRLSRGSRRRAPLRPS